MMHLNLIQQLIISILPLIFAITVHEAAHGWIASKLGDKTALILGRVTLNPIKHIDLIGTIIVPLLLLWMGGFMFGWAKPVPISPQNLRHPRRDMALVSLAGPMSNLIMAIFWALIMKLSILLSHYSPAIAYPIALMGQTGIIINLALMILNLIPIPPLDGGRIVSSLLPGRIAYYYDRIEPYGFLILLVLIVIHALNWIIIPGIYLLQQLLFIIFRI